MTVVADGVYVIDGVVDVDIAMYVDGDGDVVVDVGVDVIDASAVSGIAVDVVVIVTYTVGIVGDDVGVDTAGVAGAGVVDVAIDIGFMSWLLLLLGLVVVKIVMLLLMFMLVVLFMLLLPPMSMRGCC